jgi:hypothetical protein
MVEIARMDRDAIHDPCAAKQAKRLIDPGEVRVLRFASFVAAKRK